MWVVFANLNLTIEYILLHHLVDYVYVNDRQKWNCCIIENIALNLLSGDTL